jgi:hypothetical protein
MEQLYRIFDNQADAQAYADFARENKLPLGPDDATQIWDTPRELVDGRWVVGCANGGCVPWGEDWVLKDVAG